MSKQQTILVRATPIPGTPIITPVVFDVTDPRVPPGNKAVRYSFSVQILINEDPNDPSTHIYSEPNCGLQAGKTKEQTAAAIIQQHVDYWSNVVNGGLDPVDTIPDIMPTPAPVPVDQATLDKQTAQQTLGVAIQLLNSVNAGIAQKLLPPDDSDIAAAKQTISEVLAAHPDFKPMLASIK